MVLYVFFGQNICLVVSLTFTQRHLNDYSQPLRTTLFSLGI